MNRKRFGVFLLMSLAMITSACSPAPMPSNAKSNPNPKLVATIVPTAALTPTAVVAGQLIVLPSATAQPKPTATHIPPTLVPTVTPLPASEPILPRKPVTEPVVDEKSSSGLFSVMNVVQTVTDGVTVTTQVTMPAWVAALPPRAPHIDLPPNTINIALLGIDSRPGKEGLNNTDVIIIASINPDIPAITLLSIPRDTLVWIPGWRSHKINTAFKQSPEVFRQTILYNFGINVDYYAVVNFTGLVNAVDTLDGIDVVATCPLFHVFPKDPYYFADDANPGIVTRPYTDSFSGEVWEVGKPVPTISISVPAPGVYSLNGLQALAFARARYGIPGGDIDRGRREQLVIRALLSKARQLGSLTKIPELYGQFRNNVQTDLSLTDILKLASFATHLDDVIVRSRYIDPGGLSGMTLPVVGSVLIPNQQTMPTYISQTLRVALNQQANAGIPVELVNGYGKEGFGAAAAYRLRELGFNVLSIAQSSAPVSRTQVIDFSATRKNSAIPLLQRTFGLSSSQFITQPAQNAVPNAPRYRIVAGKDFETCYYKTPQNLQPKTTISPTATLAASPIQVVTATPAP